MAKKQYPHYPRPKIVSSSDYPAASVYSSGIVSFRSGSDSAVLRQKLYFYCPEHGVIEFIKEVFVNKCIHCIDRIPDSEPVFHGTSEGYSTTDSIREKAFLLCSKHGLLEIPKEAFGNKCLHCVDELPNAISVPTLLDYEYYKD